MLISALAWVSLGKVSGSLKRTDAFAGLKTRPDKPTTAINYLLVGSDTREGLTETELKFLKVGSTKTAAGKRSDTMLLVHISKARDNAVIISLPRDTLATIPSHADSKGKIIPQVRSKLNSAFAWGGAPLLIQTIESMTNVRIDHYIEINFVGFTRMVDALGGIEVCTKVDINDPKSHLVLSAGTHDLNGLQALKYVRTRDFDGRGDIGRMQRQQQFISSLLRKATSSGVLLNPVKVVSFLKAVMATVETDSALDTNDLITLAKQMRNLSASMVRTLTVPLSNNNYLVPGIGSTVVWDLTLSAELFQRLNNDQAIIDLVTSTPSAKPSTSPSPLASEKATTVIVDKFQSRTGVENPCGVLK